MSWAPMVGPYARGTQFSSLQPSNKVEIEGGQNHLLTYLYIDVFFYILATLLFQINYEMVESNFLK